eukprot:7144113-Pyramimonas_sp.AAC.1
MYPRWKKEVDGMVKTQAAKYEEELRVIAKRREQITLVVLVCKRLSEPRPQITCGSEHAPRTNRSSVTSTYLQKCHPSGVSQAAKDFQKEVEDRSRLMHGQHAAQQVRTSV